MKSKETFYIALYNDENKTYNLVGPINDDTEITHRTCAKQKEGNHVRCSTVSAIEQNKQEAINSIEQLGYTCDKSLYW